VPQWYPTLSPTFSPGFDLGGKRWGEFGDLASLGGECFPLLTYWPTGLFPEIGTRRPVSGPLTLLKNKKKQKFDGVTMFLCVAGVCKYQIAFNWHFSALEGPYSIVVM